LADHSDHKSFIFIYTPDVSQKWRMAALSSLATNWNIIVIGAAKVVLTIASNTVKVVATVRSCVLPMSDTIAPIMNATSYTG